MSNKNNKRPIIQSSGYNGSEPTRSCPKCEKEKPIKDLVIEKWKMGKLEINRGVKNVDKLLKKIFD